MLSGNRSCNQKTGLRFLRCNRGDQRSASAHLALERNTTEIFAEILDFVNQEEVIAKKRIEKHLEQSIAIGKSN